ncbi:PREDICTED: protein unc-80 homolog [Thamnophis sirtalis]|uniref:Protein unc-80 homolog n=1 Tax=Thamnophis sirtalis TaxID=35019 RepID=A0A6I9YK61_9SAUR|nr:PREDICTED: protein unc-80 homolog [Thamnophis sirtalis]
MDLDILFDGEYDDFMQKINLCYGREQALDLSSKPIHHSTTEAGVDQKRSVTFTEAQSEASSSKSDPTPITAQCSKKNIPAEDSKHATNKSAVKSSPTIIVADLHSPISSHQIETLATGKDTKKEEDSEPKPALAHSTSPTTQLSGAEDFTGLETTSLLQHEDTVLHISEDNGMENPLLSSQFNFTQVEMGQTDVGLDESHV